MSTSTDLRQAIEQQAHPHYRRVAEVARLAHEQNRSTAGILPRDIDLARLYTYAFRSQAIGAFHAARHEVEQLPALPPPLAACRRRATESLADLTNMAMEAVPSGFRAVLGTFYRYHQGLQRVLDSLVHVLEVSPFPSHTPCARLEEVTRWLIFHVQAIVREGGVFTARDDVAPRQNGFVVPGLGITIMPLIYGDHHSWNLAYLTETARDVPLHFHSRGAEIHLGYSPLNGTTVLGRHFTRITEGYAMPIPANTVHGWCNDSGQPHHVPFVFGSQLFGGWGIFQDVTPEQAPLASYASETDRDHGAFRRMAALEQEIEKSATLAATGRRVIIPSGATYDVDSGGLELAVSNIDVTGMDFDSDLYRIVSVVRGQGVVSIANVEKPVSAHDHFGIPADMPANVRSTRPESIVTLDAVLRC